MKNPRLVVDSITGGLVRCERSDGVMVSHPRSAFPENLKEGDLVEEKSAESFTLLPEETTNRREAAQSRLDALFGKKTDE